MMGPDFIYTGCRLFPGSHWAAEFMDGFGWEQIRFDRVSLVTRIRNMRKHGKDYSVELHALKVLDSKILSNPQPHDTLIDMDTLFAMDALRAELLNCAALLKEGRSDNDFLSTCRKQAVVAEKMAKDCQYV